MKILFADFELEKYGGITSYIETRAKSFVDLGHEVEIARFVGAETISPTGFQNKVAKLKNGTYESSLGDISDCRGFEFSPYTKQWFNIYKGHLLEPGVNLLPAFAPDAVEKWYERAMQYDIIIWNFMPTQRRYNKGMNFWHKFYDLPTDKVKQVFTAHDAYFDKRSGWVSVLEDKIHYIEAAHLPALECLKNFSIPSVANFNPRAINEDFDNLPKFSEREIDILSPQVFKSMKRVEETLKAIPYMNKDSIKFVAGAGIEMNYMMSKAEAKPRYMATVKYDPDLPQELDNKISAWDRAKEFGFEHLGQLSNEDVLAYMQNTKIVVDASYSSHYAALCNTHINGTIIECMAQGSYPVIRDYRGCAGKVFNGVDEIYNTIDALIIPHDATPKEMGEAIQAKIDSFTDETYSEAIQHNRKYILDKFFNPITAAKKTIELCSLSREEIANKLQVGKNSDKVIEQTAKVMGEFFRYTEDDFPLKWNH